ncbi:YihY/virulence factor BrkB family protein [Larkinella terrae]|uniref:YihY/virulence factor BrkB family protein n=1 Tax=Larkinella terrae TaxID=2025311 RepID=A0A7K0EJQ5_9BACT|nr:YihY/virulence factor BrkB family protein [Larkinella terrae]MRS62093.1 YihY/virulence factor BrkB family protein [Larkinella terrae]
MAAATAFFTFFALPPIVIILSQLSDELFSGQGQRVNMQLIHKLAEVFGERSARQLQDISRHLQQPPPSTWLTVFRIFLLLLASTTLFSIIKNSLNQLWRVKPVKNRRIWYLLLDRVVALGVIVYSGFLVFISLFIQEAVGSVQANLFKSGFGAEWLQESGDFVLTLILLTCWFTIVFKFLPDIRIRWRAAWVGALVTGLLVEIGEHVLDRLLITSSVNSFFGGSGAIILILLFVFYASLIFYYGASFTRRYAQRIHLAVKPDGQAVAYEIREVDNGPTQSDT